MIDIELRNADLGTAVARLKALDALKLDAVVPATAIRSVGGMIEVKGLGASVPGTVDEMLAGGGSAAGRFWPTDVMIRQIAAKLHVPQGYLLETHVERPDVFDFNVNAWLHGTSSPGYLPVDPDGRRFTVRTYTDGPEPGVGTGRALLSDKYGFFDLYESLLTFLKAVEEADPEAEVVVANLSDDKMSVRVSSPKITAAAPILMRYYRPAVEPRWAPESRRGRQVGDLVSASLRWSDGEVGNAQLQIDPMVTCLACTNGLTTTRSIDRQFSRRHLSSVLPDGIIQWSPSTMQANRDLLDSMTRDAVAAYLNPEYLAAQVAEIEGKAGKELARPSETIEVVAKQFRWDETTARTVLDHFMRSGQSTAGGVLNAVTSAAQVVASPDMAFDLEDQALAVLEAAYRAA